MSHEIKLDDNLTLFQRSYLSPCLPDTIRFEEDGSTFLLYPEHGDESYPSWGEAFEALEFSPPVLSLVLRLGLFDQLENAMLADENLALWNTVRTKDQGDPGYYLERAQTRAEEAVPRLGGDTAWEWARARAK